MQRRRQMKVIYENAQQSRDPLLEDKLQNYFISHEVSLGGKGCLNPLVHAHIQEDGRVELYPGKDTLVTRIRKTSSDGILLELNPDEYYDSSFNGLHIKLYFNPKEK